MNQRDKELARQAGLRAYQEKAPGLDGMVGGWEEFKCFADLIRADEREAILKLADSLGWVSVDDIRARGNT
jgi:hypothetical protein